MEASIRATKSPPSKESQRAFVEGLRERAYSRERAIGSSVSVSKHEANMFVRALQKDAGLSDEDMTGVATFINQEPRNLDNTSLAPIKNPEPRNPSSGTLSPKRKKIESEQEPDPEVEVQEPPTDVVTLNQQETMNLDTYSLAPIKNPQPQNMSSRNPSPKRKNIENE